MTQPPAEAPDEALYEARVHPAQWKNPTARSRYDLAILGAGPAGLAAAEAARRGGLSVALIEADRLGGNSLNVGSIPSKSLIGSAMAYAAVSQLAAYGAPVSALGGDFARVMTRMRRIRARICEFHAIDRLQRDEIDVFFGEARFASRSAILAAGQTLSFRKALIATGARTSPANIPGLEQAGYLTSDTVFDIEALPKRLAVIGGGPLGCELAQAFCRLGSQVIIVQNDAKFLPSEERDAAETLSRSLSRDGVETQLNTEVVGARRGEGEKWVDTQRDCARHSFAVDEILLSVGRVANLENLELAAAGVETEPQRGVKVDEYLRTTNPDVYAAGDVCMLHKYANVAASSGRLAVGNAFGDGRRWRSERSIPRCTYCAPEIAHIGLHVWEARQQSVPIKTYTVMMQDVARAITDGHDQGFVKIHVREGTDEIIGATIVAGRASEMINEMSVIMSSGIGMRQLADILHTYPAQSDAIRLAAVAFLDEQPLDLSGKPT